MNELVIARAFELFKAIFVITENETVLDERWSDARLGDLARASFQAAKVFEAEHDRMLEVGE